MKVLPITEDHFWKIIAQTTQFRDDADRQAKTLKNVLGALADEDILGFDAQFMNQKRRAYRWDLWGADYAIHGGASDDAFDYFRSWLITQGREVFEKALADPDSLADVIAPGRTDPLENEEFGHVASELWHHQTGARFGSLPSDRSAEENAPEGEPFEDDEDGLAKSYPKLWARFGQMPLG